MLRSEWEVAVVSSVEGLAPLWRELARMLEDATVAAMRRGRLLELLLLWRTKVFMLILLYFKLNKVIKLYKKLSVHGTLLPSTSDPYLIGFKKKHP